MKDTNPEIEWIQQDNLRTHYVTEAVDLIDRSGIKILMIPPYSPDLAPIENIFAYLKKMVYKKLIDNQVKSEDQLWQVILECWNNIPQCVIKNTIDSMPSRCQKCIKICGKNLDN